jgi:hypothetical protein
VKEHIRLCLLGCHHHPLPQQPELHSLRYYRLGMMYLLGRLVRTRLRQLVQELFLCVFFSGGGLYSKSARTSATSTPLGPRARL